MHSTELVSVIIPTYNRADQVCRAVENVLGQSYKNREVVVVDDGSTDDTQSRLEQYGSQIRVVTQANGGPGAARNRGIENSAGEIIAFLDSDDTWLPTKLERQVSLLRRAGRSVPCCVCNALLKFTDSRERSSFSVAWLNPQHEEGIWTNVPDVLSTRFLLFNQTVAVRRTVLEKIGGFEPSYALLEDYDLALRLSLEGPWGFLSEPLTIWNGGSADSLSGAAKSLQVDVKAYIVRMQESVLAEMELREISEGTLRLARRELERARRELRAVKMSRNDSWPIAAAGHLVETVERFRRSVARRAPWFPRMESSAISSSEQWV
jgi:glycosyltransferase involved in cell wall biosynthesis